MKVIGISEKGERPENQDSILIRTYKRSGLFIVADGVGGSEDGAAASSLLTDSYGQWWDTYFLQNIQSPFQELFQEIKDLAESLNEQLCSEYGAGKCCSTISLLFIHQSIYGYLSAGDSRIYLCDPEGARLITRDDIWENQPNMEGASEHRGKLLSAVGGYDFLEYSCATDRLCRRSTFFLCSDGIYKYVDALLIGQKLGDVQRSFFLKQKDVDRLITAALDGKTEDNYSLIALKI